ncbi:hypothetical protein YC2023_078506 [Brassica napus]
METSRKKSLSELLSHSSDSAAGAEEEAAEEEAETCRRLRSPWGCRGSLGGNVTALRWIYGSFEKPSEKKKGHISSNVEELCYYPLKSLPNNGDSDEKIEPDHLLVLVHGILARYDMPLHLGSCIIDASHSGWDSKSLQSNSLKKISFLAHSLGGLFARHAVAVLYSAAVSQASHGATLSNSGNSHLPRGSLAGLEPMNSLPWQHLI